MALNLSKPANDEAKFQASEPLPVVIDKIEDGFLTGFLLGKTAHGASGTRVKLKGYNASFESMLTGVANGVANPDSPIYATGPGDVVVFQNAILKKGSEAAPIFLTGYPVTRVHDGIKGELQVMKALVRPTRHTVSKRGMTQFIAITEPRIATVLKTAAEIEAYYNRLKAAPWPGGEVKILLREGRKTSEIGLEFIDDRQETPAEFAARVFDTGALGAKGLEALPLWILPAGRITQMREGSTTTPTPGPKFGRVSAVYSDGYIPGFKPSIVILHEEDEWAFGGKTGKRHRVVGGYYPANGQERILPEDLPSPVRKTDNGTHHIAFLFKDKPAMDAALERRTVARTKFETEHAIKPEEPAPARKTYTTYDNNDYSGYEEEEAYVPRDPSAPRAAGIGGLSKR